MLLRQCERIVAGARHLRVDEAPLAVLAAGARAGDLHVPRWDDPLMYQGPPELVAAWLMAFNAINYSYWPDPGQAAWRSAAAEGAPDGALGLMASLAAAMDSGRPIHEGAWLSRIELDAVESLLAPAPGAGPIPLLTERLAALRELGSAWEAHGGPMGLIEAARGSAWELARGLARACPSWEDGRILRGERLRFLKRAQLCAAMLYGRFEGAPPADFHDAGRLTAFADYRLPQVLRAEGAIVLSPRLAARIDALERIPAGSEEEVEIRAATVYAAELLRQALEPDWPGITALQVDHFLWRRSVRRDAELPPFHRTRTTDY